MLSLPFRHKGIMAAPLIGAIDIDRHLAEGQIEQVIAGGENYDGARPCDFDWIRSLSEQCRRRDVTFCFIETGTVFIKDGRAFRLPDKRLQSEMAFKAGLNHTGKPIVFNPRDPLGFDIGDKCMHKPYFRESCMTCGSRPICNGCSRCGKMPRLNVPLK